MRLSADMTHRKHDAWKAKTKGHVRSAWLMTPGMSRKFAFFSLQGGGGGYQGKSESEKSRHSLDLQDVVR